VDTFYPNGYSRWILFIHFPTPRERKYSSQLPTKRNKLNKIKQLNNAATLWHISCSISKSKYEKGDLKMKRLVTILGIVLLVGAIAIPVLANGHGWGRGRHMMGHSGDHRGYGYESGRGYETLNEEQRSKLDTLHQKFYDETTQLRNEIWSKSGELNVLLDSTNPDVDKAKALQKEISELRTKLDQVRINLELEANKINPDLRLGRGYGRGYGRHGSGYGHHMGGYGQEGRGYGRHMGGYGNQGDGYGSETCW
jgi:zinc resistance-associated protein